MGKKQKVNKDESLLEDMEPSTSTVSENLNKTDKNSEVVVSASKSDVQKKDGKSIARSCKQRLQADHDYIVSFLDALHIPNHKKDEEEEFEEDDDGVETKEEKEKRIKPGATSRASSSQEL